MTGQRRASPYEGPPAPTCVGFVEAEFPLARTARRWQYIHLPRGTEPRGVHLENRIPRGRTRGRAPSPTEDRLRTIYICQRDGIVSYEELRSRRKAARRPEPDENGRWMDPTDDGREPAVAWPVGPPRTRLLKFGRRVRSWLRMNAGGAPNTCKSNGTPLRGDASGERLSNT